MARIRTIQPHFARSPSMGRVSRDARLLFVLLWTIVDDEGRTWADPADLATVLYPRDFDAPIHLRRWLAELVAEGCVDVYTVDDVDYLRVVHWRKHQKIYHPTKSLLPRADHERPIDSGIPESSGNRLREARKSREDQALGDRSWSIRENDERNPADEEFAGEPPEQPIVVTRESLLRDLKRIQKNAEADGAHASALRSLTLLAQLALPPVSEEPREASGDAPGQAEATTPDAPPRLESPASPERSPEDAPAHGPESGTPAAASAKAAPDISPERVQRELDELLRRAKDDRVHMAAARCIDLMGRNAGLWTGRIGGPGPGPKGANPSESVGPPIDQLFTDEQKGIRR